MKFDNKILAIILLALGAIYVFNKFVKKQEVRSFKEVLVEVDTSGIDKILFYPQGTATQITLSKESNGWHVDNGSKKVFADQSAVKNFIGPMQKIKAQQLVSKDGAKWASYEVDDATGKKIELYNGAELIDAFYVGRFNFNQNTRSAKSYIRKADEADVYAVDGFISMSFQKQFDDFRDKQLLKNLEALKVNSMTLFNLGKETLIERDLNNQWINDAGIVIDSQRVAQYLNGLSTLAGQNILDDFDNAKYKSLAQLKLTETPEKFHRIKILQRENDLGNFVIKSDANEAYFTSDSSGIVKRLLFDWPKG